jgi:hypothetical protein
MLSGVEACRKITRLEPFDSAQQGEAVKTFRSGTIKYFLRASERFLKPLILIL